MASAHQPGLCNYYRRYIKNFSKEALPFFRYTKKDVPFNWTPEDAQTFDKLKQYFQNGPILRNYDPDKACRLETDACDGAIGAVLSQEDNGKWHPIAFMSKKFNDTELNYQIHDKELMAIVLSCEEWRPYLEGSRFSITCFTDHKNLTYFMTSKELNRRQVRWWEKLCNFDLDIKYKPGSENARADALSRRPDHLQDIKPVSHAILQQQDDGTVKINRQLAVTMRVQRDDVTEKRIIAAYAQDTMAQHFQDKDLDHIQIQDNGLILWQGQIYVPANKELRQDIVYDFHDSAIGGHRGVTETYGKLSASYYFPGMRTFVKNYIATCDICWKIKSQRHKPYGHLQPIDPPDRPWQVVTLDFITDLPRSKHPVTKHAYDQILVLCDKLTKYGYFLPWKSTGTSEDLAQLMVERLFAEHGMFDALISDRDKLFTAKFWQTITSQLGLKTSLSTAFHPQTDGQTERLNQTLEQYLRAFISKDQSNWVALLPLAQFAYNASKQETTQFSPFYANTGQEPVLFHEPKTIIQPEKSVQKRARDLKALHQTIKRDIEFLNVRMAMYYDRRHEPSPDLKKGDLVYLLTRNLKTTRPNKKLDYKKLGPFKILRRIHELSYKLELPVTRKRGRKQHDIFHISLLEPAPKGLRVNRSTHDISIVPEEELEDDQFIVERILDHRHDDDGNLFYHIKWQDYGDEDNTWEPENNILDKDLIEEYQRESQEQD